MEDPKVLFADTTAHRAELMAATERFKSSISNSVESMKGEASEVGKTTAFVAGAALAVYLIANAILPKSDEYRYAEKYGEPEDVDFDEIDEAHPVHKRVGKQAENIKKSAATSGVISGLVTSVLTNIAREQLTDFVARIRQNNAINPAAKPTDYHEQAPTKTVDYTP